MILCIGCVSLDCACLLVNEGRSHPQVITKAICYYPTEITCHLFEHLKKGRWPKHCGPYFEDDNGLLEKDEHAHCYPSDNASGREWAEPDPS